MVRIRPEASRDASAIEAVTIAAFRDAPHTSHTEPFIVAALRAAGALAVSLVAEVDGEIVGHVAVSPVTIGEGLSGWYGLGPISVAPGHQSRGFGSKLMHAALHALRWRGAAGCVLVGEPAFYGQFGFRATADLVYPDAPAEYFLALSFRTALPRGIVRYHAAFSAAGDAGRDATTRVE